MFFFTFKNTNTERTIRISNPKTIVSIRLFKKLLRDFAGETRFLSVKNSDNICRDPERKARYKKTGCKTPGSYAPDFYTLPLPGTILLPWLYLKYRSGRKDQR